MEYQKLGKSNMVVSKVSLGLMRIANKSQKEAVEIIKTAFECGINFFDHADIYGGGKSEIVFREAMKEISVPRGKYFLQSKVGIKPGEMYDLSKEYILESVEGILQRLDTPYLDVLLLHRFDMLWEPEKIVEAFKILKDSGKVRHFGVSNFNQYQVSYLQSKLDFSLVTNQLQFSIMHSDLVRTGIYVNTNLNDSGHNAIGLIDYLREKEITIQAWSPFQYGMFEGIFMDNDKFPELNEVLEKLAIKYKTTKTGISVAWIKKHPAKIQTIIGTMTPSRIIESAKGASIDLTREEWYEVYRSAGNKIF